MKLTQCLINNERLDMLIVIEHKENKKKVYIKYFVTVQ